ncbi:MAG: endonuclease MutS2 [Bacillota bacterium]|nr:endonuclease MutS2 [Bacillota bacterium]
MSASPDTGTAESLILLEYPAIISRLIELAASVPGRRLCQDLLPSSDLEVARERQAETADAIHLLLAHGTPPLYGIADLAPTFARTTLGAVLTLRELLEIASFLRAVNRLKRRVPDAEAERENRVYRLMDRLRPDLVFEQRISDAVVSEEEMADNASPALAAIRARQRRAQAAIREHLDRVLATKARYLQESLITQRNGRYVVPVRAEYRAQVGSIVHDTSNSGQTLFVEPLAVVEQNNRLRELAAEERDEIERILRDFSAAVAERREVLDANAILLAGIDFAVAKGRLALEQRAQTPLLNDEGRIWLRRARHPLIPQDQVVPIDLWIGRDFRSLVITGPNTGGKTVALKTTGLLTLMAMAGLAVPAADQTELAVFRSVEADIGDEQSIEQNLSTFSSHMRRIVGIVERAEPGSLILLDELGSGTDPSEGAALAIAILDDLLNRGATTVATTHYRELKAYALETPLVENACCEFDTRTLRPTYRLLIGVPGVSNAFVISRKLGLADRIIDRAAEHLSDDSRRFEALIAELDQKTRQQAQALEAAERARAAAAAERQALEAERADLKRRRDEILQQSREEARLELGEQLELLDALLQDLRRAAAGTDQAQVRREAEELRRELAGQLKRLQDDIGRATLAAAQPGAGAEPLALVVGELYSAPTLGLTGRLVSEPDSRGQVQIASGVMTVTVPAASLQRAVETPQAVNRRGSSGQVVAQKRQTFRPEIKLLGLRADEATLRLDRYLDDAVLAGAPSVRIVHGKGTGALREAVQQLLRTDRRVKSFRLAAFGEGDSGVTIAELR